MMSSSSKQDPKWLDGVWNTCECGGRLKRPRTDVIDARRRVVKAVCADCGQRYDIMESRPKT